MTQNHLKKCLTHLVIRDMQIKKTIRFHVTPIRMAKIKIHVLAHTGKDVEQGKHSSIAGESAKLYNYCVNQFDSFSENRIVLPNNQQSDIILKQHLICKQEVEKELIGNWIGLWNLMPTPSDTSLLKPHFLCFSNSSTKWG